MIIPSLVRRVLLVSLGTIAPVHVQGPDIQRQIIDVPSFNFAKGFVFRVLVPVCEPGTVRIIWQERYWSGQLQEPSPRNDKIVDVQREKKRKKRKVVKFETG